VPFPHLPAFCCEPLANSSTLLRCSGAIGNPADQDWSYCRSMSITMRIFCLPEVKVCWAATDPIRRCAMVTTLTLVFCDC
jgi:hypothetical protein